MNQNKSLNKFALASVAALMMAGLSSSVSADQFTHDIKQFTPGTGSTQILEAEANSFYNPSMGFNGWMHTSTWGYAKLKKGLPVTISATTGETKFHPAIAVWLNAGSSKIECAPGKSIGEGPYVAWEDFYVKKITEAHPGDIDPSCSKEIGKSLKMTFITNGVDRDGWNEPADFAAASKFDNTMINRILDGNNLGDDDPTNDESKVSISFTPPVTGFYKFVVGGMNPNDGLIVAPATSFRAKDISVTVNFPE